MPPSAQLRRHATLGRSRARTPSTGKDGGSASPGTQPPHPPRPLTGWVQLRLPFHAAGRTTPGSTGAATPTSPTPGSRPGHAPPPRPSARPAAGAVGSPATSIAALVILLSGHADGDEIRYSELFPALRAHGISVGAHRGGPRHARPVPRRPRPGLRDLAGTQPRLRWPPASVPTSSTGSGPCGTGRPAIPAPRSRDSLTYLHVGLPPGAGGLVRPLWPPA